MALADDIQAKLDLLNTPGNVRGRGGAVWGYDPQKKVWYTEVGGKRTYQNTTMGLPESVANVSADGTRIVSDEPGGGVLHGSPRWSQERGEYYTPFSWDKLATYGTIGLLTAGAANAIAAGGAATASGGGAATTLGPSTAANVAATSAAANAVPASLAATGTAAATGTGAAAMGFGLDDLFKYVLPTAGSLIDTVVRSKANSAANAAYQKQVDEALADARAQRKIENDRADAAVAEARRQYDISQGRVDQGLQIGAEQEAYNRALADQGVRTRAEQEAYTRALVEAGRITAAEKESYDRAETQRRLEIANEIEGYNRAKYAEAETYGRNRYANVVETLEPYRAAGVTATGRLSQLLGQPIQPYTGATYYDLAREARKPVDLPGAPTVPTLRQIPIPIPPVAGSSGPPVQPLNQGTVPIPPLRVPAAPPPSTGAPAGAANTPNGPVPSVLMQAPTGEQSYVAPDQVAAYQARGARVVGA